MRHALDLHLSEQREHGLHIDLGRGEQRFAQRSAAQLFAGRSKIAVFDVEHLSHQREPVGMHARGGKRDHDVPFLHALVVHHLVAVDDAHRKSREVVLVLGIESGHFRRLAADERAARLHAAFRDAAHDRRDLFGNVLPAGDIIEEEERFRAAADDVVHAHRHAVDAHRVVLVHEEGEFELGAHAVRARDEDGLRITRQIEREQPAESADVGSGARRHRASDVLFHEFHRFITRGDVYARLFIAFRKTLFHVCSFSSSSGIWGWC